MYGETNIDIFKIPFSRYGAYVSISGNKDEKKLMIHNVRRRFGEDNAFELIFEKNHIQIEYTIQATPKCIKIMSNDGAGTGCIYIRDDKSIVIDTFEIDICLNEISQCGYGIEYDKKNYKFISASQKIYTSIFIQAGVASLYGPLGINLAGDERDNKQQLYISCAEGKVTLCLEMSILEKKVQDFTINIESETKSIEDEWKCFLRKMPKVTEAYEDFAHVTWYNLWSSFVRKEDDYKYDAMLMSKRFMCSVWSWDHCFNALAMAEVGYRTAVEQFLLPFELQAESGALPDMWSTNSEILWGVTKPPIHGWCFNKLMDKYEIDDSMLKNVYIYLEKWTNWWMEYRDSDHDGIPEYPQGCDSGWDNSTLFDIGFFLESPDLAAFIALQMKTLARISLKLSDNSRAKEWDEKAQNLIKKMYEHSWNGERFIAKLSTSHEHAKNQTSLLEIMPLVLGELLERDKFDKLVRILEQDYLTENGPATEMLKSKLYESDGYWRGPIWAPSTYLLIDGLKRGGRGDLAQNIAKGFCNMVQNKAKGNFENFDAISGEGLRAPGYTWTASVFMLLLWEYLNV